jgi:outer membrane protein
VLISKVIPQVLILAFIGSAPVNVIAEDLLDIYALARSNDPVYQAGIHQHAASSEIYFQSRASLLPTVDFRLTHTETTQDIVSSDNDYFQSGSDKFPTDKYELSLTQSIYDYSNWKRFDKAKEDIKRVDVELEAVEQDLLLRVAESYFAALATQENYSSIASDKLAVEQHLTLVKAKRKSGQARQTDLLDAQARYLQAVSGELEIRSRFKDALEKLREITGQMPRSLKLVGELPLKKPEPAVPGDWFSVAMEFNPEIKVRQFLLSASSEEIKTNQGGHYPKLDLEVTYGSEEKEGTVFGGGSEIEETVIGLNLTIPIYAGGSVSSRVRESTQLHNRAKDELALEYRAVQRKIFSTFDGILTDISKVEALQKTVEAYELVVEAKSIGYKSGLVNSLAVLDSQRDLFFARRDYARARYGYVLNGLRLKRAVGILTLDQITEINNHLDGDEILIDFNPQSL